MSRPQAPVERCARCDKPTNICVCDKIREIETRTRVLILQHPREDDHVLGTAKLLALTLPKAILRRGLSWASVTDALGEKAEPSRFGVLYPMSLMQPLSEEDKSKPYLVLDRRGDVQKTPPRLEGVVVLDGTWSQGKSLWWRNPWLLKLNRVILHPREASIYGKLRKEPRREFVSTLEAVADVLVHNGEPETTREELRRNFRTMVQRARESAPPKRRAYSQD